MEDPDDEVRDRAVMYLRLLDDSKQEATAKRYIGDGMCAKEKSALIYPL